MQSQMKSIISFHPSVQFSAEPYERGPLSAQRTVEPGPSRLCSITQENKRRSRARRVLHRLINKERNRNKTGQKGAASPQPSHYLRTADLPFRTGGISPPGHFHNINQPRSVKTKTKSGIGLPADMGVTISPVSRKSNAF